MWFIVIGWMLTMLMVNIVGWVTLSRLWRDEIERGAEYVSASILWERTPFVPLEDVKTVVMRRRAA